MLDLLTFMFQDLAHFIGCVILLSGLGNFIYLMWNRFWRYLSIRTNGYPPPHCDADGDLREETDTKK
jgi:hypothetical protein